MTARRTALLAAVAAVLLVVGVLVLTACRSVPVPTFETVRTAAPPTPLAELMP